MEPKASSPYRRLYGYRREGTPPLARQLAQHLTPTSSQKNEHTHSHTHSRIPYTLYIRLSGGGGK